ncbi:Pls/PosA family non-ribosomal peptide synthetase [Streptomyces sp. NPDC047117]|uniref:Pls/PosA family non-ribosomal peptide synthetase n=1 Tax=unclassified Streptomyces TaxID=2593676 RepID=UPI0033C931C8
MFAEVLAGVLNTDRVSADSHFFDDLGANSLLMAQFCARVRKRDDLPSVSMKDVYRHPTVRGLATALPAAPTAAVGSQVPAVPEEGAPVGSTPRYILCGALQLLIFLGYSYLAGMVMIRGYTWVSAGSGLVDVYLRSAFFGSAGFVAMCLFPVAAKWILVGRWRATEFPVWSLGYLRFWTVRVLINANPMRLFIGNPLYVLYLRALGARIGKNVTILSHAVPVCTDLLTIGAGTVIRKEAFFLCYRAHAGRIQTGPVTLGRDVFIGERTVLDIKTSMGDGAQLGHASALQTGEAVPAGQRWHGSPAERTELNYVRVAPTDCGALRRFGYGFLTLLQLFLIALPLAVGVVYMVLTEIPALGKWLGPGTEGLTSAELYTDALLISVVVFFGFTLLGMVWLFTVPRLLNLLIRPDRVYPLYGFHYSVHRAIARMTNIKFFKWLFGDSSYIVHYLRCLGYDLSKVEQTGSNFGTGINHETPFLSKVGSGTMVADGLSMINADFSSTSFRVSRTEIGAQNFLGNFIAYPAGGRTGENCLLATKVMVPLDGKLRENVGLLGSPSFEIPRTVERDTRFDHFRTGREFRRRLAAKNRHNITTMGIFLFLRWVHVYVLTVLAVAGIELYGVAEQLLVAAYMGLSIAFTGVYFALVERVILRFRPLRPQLCSIYEPYFWWHERLWKVPDTHFMVYNGTPFKNLLWRLMGVRLGKRVFDDGCYLTERTLTTIGDDATLNTGSKVQCHSQEDGTFKSDHSTIGAGSTLGVGAMVHYGVTVGDGAVIGADSFLMKGEEVPQRVRWAGNPATEMRAVPHRSA